MRVLEFTIEQQQPGVDLACQEAARIAERTQDLSRDWRTATGDFNGIDRYVVVFTNYTMIPGCGESPSHQYTFEQREQKS